MNTKPLISVIIPVYGVEKYIAQCLESVIKQTYKNLEILVINDGTKDNSALIAKLYSEKDARIKVYDFPNGGLSVARNRGLEIAKGDYIAYLDSDDWIDSKMYETLLNTIIENGADMVKCGFYISENDKLEEVNFGGEKVFENTFNNSIDLYFNGILWTVVWNALYSRELAKKVFFPENVVHEDNYSAGMFLFFSKRIVNISYCGSYYRVNNFGISKGGIKRPLDKILAIAQLRKDLLKYKFYDERLDRKLSIELYHFIRGWNNLYNVISVNKNLYFYIIKNLPITRRLLLKILIIIKHIKLVDGEYV